ALTLLAACGGDKEIDPPAELTDIAATLPVKRVWSVSLGGGAERLRLALRPTVVDGVLYAANHDGDVFAMSADSGRRIWSARARLPLSPGPEAAGGGVVLGPSDGDGIALEAADGAERWRKTVGSEVLASPLVVNDLVVVRTVNGRLEALSITDGASRWSVDESVPRLTLRGTAARSEEHTSELQSRENLVCRLLLEKKKKIDDERH